MRRPLAILLLLPLVLLTVLLPFVGWAAPAFVQSSSNSVATGTSVSTAYPSNVTAGNLLVGCIFSDVGVTGVSGSIGGQTWSLVSANTDGATFTFGMYYFPNTAGGANTITATLSGTTAYTHLILGEWNGVDPAPLDQKTNQFQAAPGTGTDAVTSGNVTTTTDGQLIVGCGNSMTYAADQLSAGTGFTIRQSHFGDNPMEDRIQTSAGSIAATFTSTSATNNYVPIVGTFKAAAVAGTPYFGARLRGAY